MGGRTGWSPQGQHENLLWGRGEGGGGYRYSSSSTLRSTACTYRRSTSGSQPAARHCDTALSVSSILLAAFPKGSRQGGRMIPIKSRPPRPPPCLLFNRNRAAVRRGRTCPVACTPASVRDAPTTRTGWPYTRRAAFSSSPCAVQHSTTGQQRSAQVGSGPSAAPVRLVMADVAT